MLLGRAACRSCVPRAIGELESPRRRGRKRAEGGRRAVRADGEGRTRDGAARGREAGRPRGGGGPVARSRTGRAAGEGAGAPRSSRDRAEIVISPMVLFMYSGPRKSDFRKFPGKFIVLFVANSLSGLLFRSSVSPLRGGCRAGAVVEGEEKVRRGGRNGYASAAFAGGIATMRLGRRGRARASTAKGMFRRTGSFPLLIYTTAPSRQRGRWLRFYPPIALKLEIACCFICSNGS